ncbi:sodium:solute symporter family protein [Lentisphaerota bacterium WC36G]|nr:sodium:solute symporter family protein [Lentisphaerae bacterium WC36]
MNYLPQISLLGLAIYFAILLIVVLHDNKRKKENNNTNSYFFGSHKLPFWMLSLTFIASWWGGGSAMMMADKGFESGIGAFWVYGMPVLFSTFLMIVMAKVIRNINCATQGEMLELRYGKLCGLICSVITLIFMTLTAASQMVAIGDFFENFLGFSYNFAVIFGTYIVLVYSLFGGFRGVVFTDIVQFVFLTTTILIVIGALYFAGGNFSCMIDVVKNSSNKETFFSFGAGAKKYSIYFITFGAAWMIQANVWQRIQATKNATDAVKMTTMSFFAYIPLYLLAVITGMLAIAVYTKLPKGGVVVDVISNHTHPILSVLAFVGLTSAIMSTMDSLINTASLIFTNDIYKRYINKNANEKKQLSVAMITTFTVTIIGVLISLEIRSILKLSWIAADFIATGVFFPLVLGFIFRRGNNIGAISCMIFGTIYTFIHLLINLKVPHKFLTLFYNVPLEKITDDFFIPWELNSPIQVCVGMLSALIVYLLMSIITKEQFAKADAFMKRAKTHEIFDSFIFWPFNKVFVLLKIPVNKD